MPAGENGNLRKHIHCSFPNLQGCRINSRKGHVFTEEHMGMLTECELMATCLAGGLGVTRERLERTLGRLIRPSPLIVRGGGEEADMGKWNALNTAAVAQALRELNDIWLGMFCRPVRFREIERLLTRLKDRILDEFGCNSRVLLNYHRLAQNLNDLKLTSSGENSKPY